MFMFDLDMMIITMSGSQARIADGPRDAAIFAHDYLKPIIRDLTEEHRKIIQARMDGFVTPFILVSVAFVLAMLIMYATLYRRMLSNLDMDIKQLRSWLMLFPPEIIR